MTTSVRWKKVEVDVFQRMRGLSPDAQLLYLFLRCSDVTCMLPGLQEVGPGQLAERLRMTPEGFRSAWTEIERLGLARADWEARLVYLPGVIAIDVPLSPNVVTGWAKDLSSLPPCGLLSEAVKDFAEVFQARSKRPRNKGDKADPLAFLQAFDAVVSKSFGESLPTSSPESSVKSSPQIKDYRDKREEQQESESLISLTTTEERGIEMNTGLRVANAVINIYNNTLNAIRSDIDLEIPIVTALGKYLEIVNELLATGYSQEQMVRACTAFPFSAWHMGFQEDIKAKGLNREGEPAMVTIGTLERERRFYLEDVLKVRPKDQIVHLNFLYTNPPRWTWRKYGLGGAVFFPLIEEWKAVVLEAAWDYQGMDKVIELIESGAELVLITDALQEAIPDDVQDKRFILPGGK